MKNRIYVLLIYIFLIGCMPIFSVGNKAHTDPKVQIMQPSSDAQSLGKFAEIPVDLYTGRTNINIPLFTISYNDIEIPISISYHGGGVKVTDAAGSVGLGWTLNASGVVSRIVRGMPDELYKVEEIAGYNRLEELEINTYNDYYGFIDTIKNKPIDSAPTNIASSSASDEEKVLLHLMENYGILYDEGHYDTSPDNFLFSVQGLCGAFVSGHVDQKQSNIGCTILQVLDSVSKAPKAFYITDVNGFTYFFNKLEKQYYPYKVSNNLWMTDWETIEQQKFLYASAWWINSIKSPAGDSVTFNYKTIKKRHRSPHFYAYTQYKYMMDEKHEKYECNFISPYNYFMDTVHHQHTLLTEITTPHCRLVFHYSKEDMPQADIACLVDSISLYATNATNGLMREVLIERYKFTYSGIDNRARLLRLIHQGKDGGTQCYDFTYHSAIYVDKDEKDHWGYYSPDSKGAFPDMTYLDIMPQSIPINRASTRHANNEYADNNTLASITYPSGLQVKLTWEPHDYSNWSHVGGKVQQITDKIDAPIICDTILRNRFELCGKIGCDSSSSSLSITQYLYSNQYVDVDLSHYFYESYVWNIMGCVMNWRENYQASDLPEFVILLNGQEVFHSYLDSMSIQPNTAIKSDINNIVRNHGSGQYTFQLKNPRSTLKSPTSEAECSLYYDMFNNTETELGKIPIKIYEVTARPNSVNDRNVGGVRIKKIEYYQGNNQYLCKEYSYVDSMGNSTGVLAYPPRYASKYQILHTTFLTGETNVTIDNNDPYALFLRSEGLPYTLNGSGHIEYKQVNEATTYQGYPINRIEYYYRTSEIIECSDVDDTNYGTLIPTDMIQLTSKKHQRGHLWKQVEYTDEHKTTLYRYTIIEKQEVITHTGALFPIADFKDFALNISGVSGPINPYKNFGIVKYRVIPYNKRLQSQTTIGDKTNTYHAYTYKQNTYSSALNADYPLTHTYVTSEGDTLIEHFTYKENTNKITRCITEKQGLFIAGYQLIYDDANRVIEKHIAQIDPTNLPSIESDIRWDTMEVYKYNPYINQIEEISNKKTNITTTYLWSYRGLYPIAEVINASLSEVESKISRDIIRDLQSSYTPNMSIVNNLRNLLPDANINTMTYEPLIGMSSFTDPKGYTQYYEYDDFKRVKTIYEKVNDTINILKQFDYQEANR